MLTKPKLNYLDSRDKHFKHQHKKTPIEYCRKPIEMNLASDRVVRIRGKSCQKCVERGSTNKLSIFIISEHLNKKTISIQIYIRDIHGGQ